MSDPNVSQNNQQNNQQQNGAVNVDALAARIDAALGFNPTSSNPSGDCFAAALAELQEERTKELQVKAKDYLKQLREARIQQAKIDTEYRKSCQTFQKTVGKILNRVEAMARGEQLKEEQEQQS